MAYHTNVYMGPFTMIFERIFPAILRLQYQSYTKYLVSSNEKSMVS